ncbi:MAG: glycerophosphoryl diester phosphodiesterase [Rhodothermales bacterium]|jgi:glycerophosphoryl diester phosphodiesterase
MTKRTWLFDLQGHRGARGLLPENTLPAFGLALELGVRTLELDVGISADHRVVVSHDPVISREICSHPDGTAVTTEIRLFDLPYGDIALFDCGARGNPRFPDQKPMAARKPLLQEVITFEKDHSAALGRAPALWNIETKSTPAGDGRLHPGPEIFATLVYGVLQEGGILNRTVVQSFDVRTLQVLRTMDPALRLALLVEEEQVEQLDDNLQRLGFVPEVYSPDHTVLTGALVRKIKAAGMKTLPWTVNEPARMEELLEMGVDGFITDYPDRGMALLRQESPKEGP